MIPTDWLPIDEAGDGYYIGELWDAARSSPGSALESIGSWQVGRSQGDRPGVTPCLRIQFGPDDLLPATAKEILEVNFGPTGENRIDPNGNPYYVEESGGWNPPDVDGARDKVLLQPNAGRVRLYSNESISALYYVLVGEGAVVGVLVQFPGPVQDDVVASIEEALQTVEFYP